MRSTYLELHLYRLKSPWVAHTTANCKLKFQNIGGKISRASVGVKSTYAYTHSQMRTHIHSHSKDNLTMGVTIYGEVKIRVSK